MVGGMLTDEEIRDAEKGRRLPSSIDPQRDIDDVKEWIAAIKRVVARLARWLHWEPFAPKNEWIAVKSTTGLQMKRWTGSAYEFRQPTSDEVKDFIANDAW